MGMGFGPPDGSRSLGSVRIGLVRGGVGSELAEEETVGVTSMRRVR